MILLESGNRIVAETVKGVIIPDPDYKPLPFNLRISDFDNAAFNLVSNDADSVEVSLALPCFHQIADFGAKAAVDKAFGSFVAPEAEKGYDVTVKVTKADWTGKEQEIIDLLASLKRVALGGVFEYFLAAVGNNTSGSLQPFKFNLRPDTTVHFVPGADRVAVIFLLSFIDKADQVIGKVFLTEFADPSIRRKAQRAPSVTFSPQPPAEMKAFGVDTASEADLGYVTFTLQPIHCADAVRAKAVETIQTFRNFVQYHLKCAKAYFHSRMRARVVDLTKVLNRAKIDQTKGTGSKATITATGKLLIKR